MKEIFYYKQRAKFNKQINHFQCCRIIDKCKQTSFRFFFFLSLFEFNFTVNISFFYFRVFAKRNSVIMLKIQMLEQIVSNENMREQQDEQQKHTQSPIRSPNRTSPQNGLVYLLFVIFLCFFRKPCYLVS